MADLRHAAQVRDLLHRLERCATAELCVVQHFVGRIEHLRADRTPAPELDDALIDTAIALILDRRKADQLAADNLREAGRAEAVAEWQEPAATTVSAVPADVSRLPEASKEPTDTGPVITIEYEDSEQHRTKVRERGRR